MKKVLTLVLSLILLSNTTTFGQTNTTTFGQTDKESVYVWDFATRDSKKNDLTSNFSDEFETALLEAGCYNMLQRQKYNHLIAQRDNEKAILSIDSISSDTLKNFKTVKADMYIFGEISDDIESGEIKITVVFQEFDSRIILKKDVSLPRGLRLDSNSRKEAMKTLAQKICSKKIPLDQPGLKGEYYNLPPSSGEPEITGEPDFIRVDSEINFKWGNGSPAPKITSDHFYVRWTGSIYIKNRGNHEFAVFGSCSDNYGWERESGVQFSLEVNKSSIFPKWSRNQSQIMDSSSYIKSGIKEIFFNEGGKWYPIKLEMYDRRDCASLILSWKSPGESELNVIPSSVLKTN